MIKPIHPIAGGLAILTIATCWLSTVLSELVGSQSTIVAVKMAIPRSFLLLIPAIAMAGGTGLALAQGRRGGLVGGKAGACRRLLPAARREPSNPPATRLPLAQTPPRSTTPAAPHT
ncbi:MAG: hypothetical protein AB7U66_05950 [Hyphomicrobiaceae bacterium]